MKACLEEIYLIILIIVKVVQEINKIKILKDKIFEKLLNIKKYTSIFFKNNFKN